MPISIVIVIAIDQTLLLTFIISSILLAPFGWRHGYQCKAHNFVDSRGIIEVDASVGLKGEFLFPCRGSPYDNIAFPFPELDCKFTSSTCTWIG